MAYHTEVYLFAFLPLVLLAYQLAPGEKMRRAALAAAGYGFFILISKTLVIYLLGAVLISYVTGVWMGQIKQRCRAEVETLGREERKAVRKKYQKRERLVLAGGIILLLSALAYLKYYNFFAENVNVLLQSAGSGIQMPQKTILAPIGISFYTLQAIGYMVDVYWEKVPAGENLGKLALFLGFFPQIMEGPIALYSQTADSLWHPKPLKAENLSWGCLRIFWGLFKKMVIADRLYVLVQAVFDNYEQYSGVVVAASAVAYTVQLYMEFSGCMDIVIGSGKMFGVELPENFCQPFASRNAAEFWRRWHITLGVWFKTYLFYPVSASSAAKKWNRFGKKHFGKHTARVGAAAMALFPVWLCNGLWHGARWSYLFYGMYYFVLLFASVAVEPLRDQALKVCHINEDAFYWRIVQILKTWMIIFTGELFFRADSLTAGVAMFQSIFRDFGVQKLWDGTFLSFGLDKADYLAIAAGCVIVAAVGIIRERNLLDSREFQKLRLPIRWAVYYGLAAAVILFGAYGAGYQLVDLIYAGF